ncbi:MAG: GNAT family N-acetyltransferase [Motiliproteus sp.]
MTLCGVGNNVESGVVRTAIPTDAEAITRLSQGLGYTQKDNAAGNVDAQQTATVERLIRLLDATDQQVWVFDAGGELRGWLHAFIGLRLASPPFVEIGGLVVESSYHRRGIATQLLAVVRYWADQQGLPLRVRCHSQRQAAQQFYRAQGLQAIKQQTVFESMTESVL